MDAHVKNHVLIDAPLCQTQWIVRVLSLLAISSYVFKGWELYGIACIKKFSLYTI